MEFLTEKKLKTILDSSSVYEFVHNKKFYDESFRPDFVCKDLKLIIEFDGYRHYNSSKTQNLDFNKNEILRTKYPDWRMVKIPYFIQLTNEVYQQLFFDELKIDKSLLISDFPHGFIDDKALSPIDFNIIGWNLFLYQMGWVFRMQQYDVFNSCKLDLIWMYNNSICMNISEYPFRLVESGYDINGMIKHFVESNLL